MKPINPDPSKYVIRVRRGKAILVDKQILRWRAANKKRAPKKVTPVKLDVLDRIKKLF